MTEIDDNDWSTIDLNLMYCMVSVLNILFCCVLGINKYFLFLLTA